MLGRLVALVAVAVLGIGCGDSAEKVRLTEAIARIAKLEAQLTARRPSEVLEVVELRRLVLRDAHGSERAVLETAEDGQTCLRVCDERGSPRVWLSAGRSSVAGNGSVIAFLDGAGVQRVSLGELDSGDASLMIHDRKGNARAEVVVQADGTPRVQLLDAGAHAGAYLAMELDGTTALQLGRADKNPSLVAVAGPDGSGSFRCFDQEQNLRAEMSAQRDGAPGVYVLDPKGVVRAVLGTATSEDPKGGAPIRSPSSTLLLLDASGNVLKRLP